MAIRYGVTMAKDKQIARDCQRRYKAKKWQDPEYRERMREYRKGWYGKIKQFLAEEKLRQGCVDCGYKEHAVALDFDHVDGDKTINVSKIRSMKVAIEEIKKCVVRCANCHRVVSQERLEGVNVYVTSKAPPYPTSFGGQ